MKKVFSILLALIMVLSLLPTVAMAEEGDEVAKIGETKYDTLAEAVSNAKDGDTIELLQYKNGDENYNFTMADDGFCYVDAANKTGRLVWLDIANIGSASAETTFYVNGVETARTIQNILLDSKSRLDAPGTLLKSGDIVILPAGNLYMSTGSTIDDVYGDITFVGAGKGSTTICPLIGGSNYRFFRLYNRYTKNIVDNVIYHYNFKNLTFDGQYAPTTGALNLFVVTCYNIDISMDTVDVKNFDGAVFSVWANDTLNDAGYDGDHAGFTQGSNGYYPTKAMNSGVTINLKNVTTNDNGKLIHFDCSPYQARDLDADLDCYAYIHLNYDGTCSFDDQAGVAGNHVFTDPNHPGYDTATFSVNGSTAYCQNNCLINGVDVLPPVAQITKNNVTTGYATLAAAIEDAKSGDTITLLDNVTENVTIPTDKSLTLNLNGKTINGGNQNTASNKPAITNNGNLTITGDGTIERVDTGSSAYYVIANIGNLTFDKNFTGTVTNGSGITPGHAGASVIQNGSETTKGTLNIQNGTFSQNNFNVIKSEEMSEINISGGTITCGSDFAVLSYDVLNITGGVITGPVCTRTYGSYNATTNITGGKINGNVISAKWNSSAEYSPLVNISGSAAVIGTVTTSDPQNTNAVAGSFSITGGVFSPAAPSATYIAANYEAVQIAANKYIVQAVSEETKGKETIYGAAVTTDAKEIGIVAPEVVASVGAVKVTPSDKPASGSVAAAVANAGTQVQNAITQAQGSGTNVEVKVTTAVNVETAAENSKNAIENKVNAADSAASVLKSIEVTVSETVTVTANAVTKSSTIPVTETEYYQLIKIPFTTEEMGDKSSDNLIVYRQHGDEIAAMRKVSQTTGAANPNYECFWIDDNNVVIRANKFSTYSLVLATAPVPVYTPSYHGGSYTPSAAQTITTDLPAGSITKVTVDGKTVDSKYYTISGGNVTLTDAYIKTLSNGKHTVAIENATHISKATITVNNAANAATVKSGKTGDAGILLYGALAVSSVLGMGWVGKKKIH